MRTYSRPRAVPRRRQARAAFGPLGYVGRLSIEKNVGLLPQVAARLQALARSGDLPPVRFLIVGQGAEEAALRAALPAASFPGVLRGPALAEAYANMDCFLFPSHTDTFGNVVLEALACGVPAVVTPQGGPAHIIEASQGGGCVVEDDEFAGAVAAMLKHPEQHARMRARARGYGSRASWDAVFESLYAAYEQVL